MRRVITAVLVTAAMVALMYAHRGEFVLGGEWLLLPGILAIDGAFDAVGNVVSVLREEVKR